MLDAALYTLSFGLIWAGTIWLVLTFATFLHESAHVVAGRVAGLQPIKVDIGNTPWIVRLNLASIEWRVGLRPSGGLVTVKSMLWRPTWRHLAYAGAGLCSDLFVLLLLAWGYEQSVAHYAMPTSVNTALRHALIIEAITFLYSAIPMSNAGRDGIPNDGYHIMAILKGDYSGDTDTSKRWENNVRRYDPAFSIDDSWLLHDDAGLNTRCEEWQFRLANRQFDRAVTAFAAFMATDLIKGGERAMYLDEMASLAVVAGHKELLPYALEWTREARKIAPSSRTLLGTLGSVLVETGDVEAGMALLTSLTTPGNDSHDHAIACCYLAKAHHRLGNPDEARRLLAQARSLNPPAALLDRIAAEIGPQRPPRK